jgi:hypothetical protein
MPLTNILDNKFGFMDLEHIAPYYIDKLSWWEYEEYVKRLNDRIDRENKQQKENSNSDGAQQSVPDFSKKMPNMNSMMSNLNKYKP